MTCSTARTLQFQQLEDVVTYDNAFIEERLASPQTLYALQVMADRMPMRHWRGEVDATWSLFEETQCDSFNEPYQKLLERRT